MMEASEIEVGMVFIIPAATDIARKVTVISITGGEVEYTIEKFADGLKTPAERFAAWVSRLDRE